MKRKKKYLENLYNFDKKSNSYEINLSLRNYEEVYNPFDYSQYKRRDMDEDFLDYVYEESLGIPLKYNIKLNMHLKKEVYDENKTKNLKNGIKNNFAWRLTINLRKLNELYQKCILLLFAGVFFLGFTFFFAGLVKSDNSAWNLFIESLSILGWVFLWDLVEILVFDLTKLIKKRKLLKRLVKSKVEVEVY